MFHSAISLQYLLLGKLGYNLFGHLYSFLQVITQLS